MATVTINNELIENIFIAEFSDILNEINKAEINFQADNFQKDKSQIGDIVRYETLVNTIIKVYDFVITNRMSDDNRVKLICRGTEEIAVNIDIDLTLLTNATKVNTRAGNYNGVNSSLIYADLISHLPDWSLNLSNPVVVDNFRIADSESVWNAESRLANLLGQEITIDYLTKTFIIADNLGTNKVDIINEKTDFEGRPQFTEQRAKGKKVIVFGKGDGDNQIKAIAQDAGFVVGDPTIKLEDPNITSQTEAQTKADVELLKQKQNIEHYIIPRMKVGGSTGDISYDVSDTIIVNSPSVGLVDRELKIVKIKYIIIGGDEGLVIEVNNAEYSRALKSATQRMVEEQFKRRIENTTNQGSGNTLTFGNQINGTNTNPLVINFNLPKSFIKDEAGNIRVNSMTVDYDIDPYRKGVGDATFNGGDPQVQNSSANTLPDVLNSSGSDDPTVTGFSGSTEIVQSEGSNFFGTTDLIGGSWVTLTSETIGTNYWILFFHVRVNTAIAGTLGKVELRIRRNGTTIFQERVGRNWGDDSPQDLFYVSYTFPSIGNTIGTNWTLEMFDHGTDSGLSVSGDFDVYGLNRNHDHGDGTYNVINHSHADGTYAAENHDHEDGSFDIRASDIDNISIGDSVSDAASVFATSTDLFLDFWNGSIWVNKHSVVTSGVTLKTDVDITNGGVFPDVEGFWRVRVFTNSGNADLIKGIVKLKHNLDN